VSPSPARMNCYITEVEIFVKSNDRAGLFHYPLRRTWLTLVHRIIQTLLESIHPTQRDDLPIHCQYPCFHELTACSLTSFSLIPAFRVFLWLQACGLPLLCRLVKVQGPQILIMSSSTHTRTRTTSETIHLYTQEERQAVPR
jgi:hypothetical protein